MIRNSDYHQSPHAAPYLICTMPCDSEQCRHRENLSDTWNFQNLDTQVYINKNIESLRKHSNTPHLMIGSTLFLLDCSWRTCSCSCSGCCTRPCSPPGPPPRARRCQWRGGSCRACRYTHSLQALSRDNWFQSNISYREGSKKITEIKIWYLLLKPHP